MYGAIGISNTFLDSAYVIKTNIISFRNGFNSFGITLCGIAIVMYRMVLKNGRVSPRKEADIPIAPSLYSLSNKMANNLTGC